jgi:hypothetical protein
MFMVWVLWFGSSSGDGLLGRAKGWLTVKHRLFHIIVRGWGFGWTGNKSESLNEREDRVNDPVPESAKNVKAIILSWRHMVARFDLQRGSMKTT